MGENAVSRYEFELYRRDMERRVARLEGEVEELEDQHDRDMAALAAQRSTELRQAHARRTHRWEWRWETLIAALVAGAALAGLWFQAAGR